MANLLVVAKEFAKELPEPIGRLVPYIPFYMRFGLLYTRSRQDIVSFGAESIARQKEILFERIQTVVNRAFVEIPFYKNT